MSNPILLPQSWRAVLGVMLAVGLFSAPATADPGAKAKPKAPTKPKENDVVPLPHSHPPLEVAPGTPQEPRLALPPEGSGTGKTSVAWTAPSGWKQVAPGSPMRKAQYEVGGIGGAIMVVYYFGPLEGGGAMPNIERWAGQFTLPDGRRGSEAMQVRQRTVNGLQVVTVEVAGNYAGDLVTPGVRPDHMLLGAIAVGPDANWFFKLTGPRATLERERTSFEAFVASLRPGS